jgi:hypothetical protein
VPAGPAAGATSHELFGPVGVDSDAAGRLFVVDTTSRLFVIDHSGALLAMIGNQFPTLGAIERGPEPPVPTPRIVVAGWIVEALHGAV